MSKVSRRRLVQAGGGLAVTGLSGAAVANAMTARSGQGAGKQVPPPVEWDWGTGATPPATQPRMDPNDIPKFEDDLPIPRPLAPQNADSDEEFDRYTIGLRQIDQALLPTSMGIMTKVWAYGDPNHPETYSAPGPTIEARVDRPVRVKWINELVDEDGNYIPSMLPIDPTLHWANPEAGVEGRDSRHIYTTGETPEPYTGPVPLVTHLHGIHVSDESDGYPEAWYLPDAANIPDGYALVGSLWEDHAKKFEELYGEAWEPGSAVAHYKNEQGAAPLFYHDHALGMTRINVYSGAVGLYLLRGGRDEVREGSVPAPAPQVGDAPDTAYYEIPLVIQDRSFTPDGQLFYPNTRYHFDLYPGPYIPDSDISPIYVPEFFGDAILVNGKAWPKLTVEPRRYRFRVYNACGSRFLILKLAKSIYEPRRITNALPMWQIGGDSSYLQNPVVVNDLLLAPGERADIILDFTGLEEGTSFYLANEGPDEPFSGGQFANRTNHFTETQEALWEEGPQADWVPADVVNSGVCMKFEVGPLKSEDTSQLPHTLVLPAQEPEGRASIVRKLALVENNSQWFEFGDQNLGIGPMETVLGVVDENGQAVIRRWSDPITETPQVDVPEVWEFHNFTEDAHPIHIHETFQRLLDRESMQNGISRAPEANESGFKDTVIAYPNEITRVKVRFRNEGLFVWHCHVLEHEDHEMMRPLRVLPNPEA